MSKEKAIKIFEDLLQSYYYMTRDRNRLKRGQKHITVADTHREHKFSDDMRRIKERFLAEINELEAPKPMWQLIHSQDLNGSTIYAVQQVGTPVIRLLDNAEYEQFISEGKLLTYA